MDGLVDLDDGQFLHSGEELVLSVEPAVVSSVKDSLVELLITGSSELEDFVFWSGGGLSDVTSPLYQLELPGRFRHVQGKFGPGQSLQLGGGRASSSSRGRLDWSWMSVLSVVLHDLEHQIPLGSVGWSLVGTARDLALKRSRGRHDVDH